MKFNVDFFKETNQLKTEEQSTIPQSENILNWYPFEKQMKVLEIGGNTGELTGILCDKCEKVVTIEPNLEKAKQLAEKHNTQENLEVIVGTLKNIQLNEKYDIITLIGIIPKLKELMETNSSLIQIIKYLEKYLTENGKIIIAIDNKFGLRYFSGNPENIYNQKFESLIGYNDRQEKPETFTKTKLEKELQTNGYNTRFYYPLPDYKIPNVIFTEEQQAKYNSIDKYTPYSTEKSDTIINEIDVYREILKTDENMFTFFANSFLVEISRKETNKLYKYISFNNIRKPQYRLITKISDQYVEKQPVNKEANLHYEQIKRNIKILNEKQIKTVDYIENDIIRSKYIEQKYLLNNVLTQYLEQKETEKFDQVITRYIDLLKIGSYKTETPQQTIFGEYNLVSENNEEILKDLNYLENGLWDMTFKNCFYKEDEFYFFDQEWNEKNLPIEFILYRSILYTISLRRYINIDILFQKYGLDKYKEIFEQLDNKLQEKIRDEKQWEFYNKNTYFNIDDTKQELKNVMIRDNAKQQAIENLQKEKEQIINQSQEVINNLQEENQKIAKQLQIIQEKENKKITKRIYRKIKKIFGGKNEQKN